LPAQTFFECLSGKKTTDNILVFYFEEHELFVLPLFVAALVANTLSWQSDFVRV
jgi:hypothetical protein